MGTISHSYGKPYGYDYRPNTCRWCGDTLRYMQVAATDADKGDPSYRERPYLGATKRAARPGGYQDGKFCSLRCGYQWAVRAA